MKEWFVLFGGKVHADSFCGGTPGLGNDLNLAKFLRQFGKQFGMGTASYPSSLKWSSPRCMRARATPLRQWSARTTTPQK